MEENKETTVAEPVTYSDQDILAVREIVKVAEENLARTIKAAEAFRLAILEGKVKDEKMCKTQRLAWFAAPSLPVPISVRENFKLGADGKPMPQPQPGVDVTPTLALASETSKATRTYLYTPDGVKIDAAWMEKNGVVWKGKRVKADESLSTAAKVERLKAANIAYIVK